MILVTKHMHICWHVFFRYTDKWPLEHMWYMNTKNIDYVWDAYCKNNTIWMKIEKTRLPTNIFDHWMLLKRICGAPCIVWKWLLEFDTTSSKLSRFYNKYFRRKRWFWWPISTYVCFDVVLMGMHVNDHWNICMYLVSKNIDYVGRLLEKHQNL